MNKVLKLIFKNDEGKATTITVRNPKDGLDEATVKDAMQKVVDANVFENDGVKPYAAVDSAKYYTTQSDNIFDVAE